MSHILQLHDVPTPGPEVTEHRSRRKGCSPSRTWGPCPSPVCVRCPLLGHPQLMLPELTWGLFSGEAESKQLMWFRRLELIWKWATHPILQVCLYC